MYILYTNRKKNGEYILELQRMVCLYRSRETPLGETSLPECEACKKGIEEEWKKFVKHVAEESQESLVAAWVTWWKRTIDYRLDGCERHAEEASDRRDYLSVERDMHLFSSGKMTPSRWLEGRNKARRRGFNFWHPPGIHDEPLAWENIPKMLVEYRRDELDTFCYG